MAGVLTNQPFSVSFHWQYPPMINNESTELLAFFSFEHLPQHLQEISEPFAVLAESVFQRAPEKSETTAALRKLLEAKDCAVRAAL